MKVDLDDEEAGTVAPSTRARHIGKRALKNKGVSVSFDEKDLRDFVTGFHKRKKKRRKEAQKQQEEAMRRKRIEARKKRKLEERMVAGLGEEGTEDVEADEDVDEDAENEEEAEPDASISGTTMYDTGELKVTVTTSEISREDDEPIRREKTQSTEPGSKAKASAKHPVPVKKTKPMKQNRRKSSTKTMKKRDKRKQARGIKTSR